VDLGPDLALLLKNYIGDRQSGLLFETSGGLPLSPRNITRDSLHPILKTMGRTSAGFHIFRRFRDYQCSKQRPRGSDFARYRREKERKSRLGGLNDPVGISLSSFK
jgi:hypothetical protein